MSPKIPETIEDEEKRKRALEALSKFNFFLHLTMWLSASAYLLILGILIPRWLIYTLIPIILWTIGLAYHGYRAFFKKTRKRPSLWQLAAREGVEGSTTESPETHIREPSHREP